MSRKKVTDAHLCGPLTWQQWWDCKLVCGHVITVKGKNGKQPKTATCYKCED